MSLAKKTARAAIWAFVATAGGKVITFVSLTVLARLLAPAEFGLLAFAMAYMTYVEAIGDLGSGAALIYWPDRREDAAQVTFVVNALAGIGWCVTTLLLAPYIADFFHAPTGAPLVRALAFGFFIKYLSNAHDALLQKDLRFRARLGPEVALAALKAVIAVVLAWRGFGAWSLVWGHLAGLTLRTVMLWIKVDWRPSLRVPWDLLKPMLAYGRGIISVNVLAAITHHADLAVIGRILGTTALGLYQMAGKIPETSIVVMLWVAGNVLFPAFARKQNEGESLRRPYLIAAKYLAAIILPAATGLIVLSRPIILIFFGPAWMAAAPILAALSAHTALRGLATAEGNVLTAKNRAPLLAGMAIPRALLLIPALWIGAQYSATAAAIAMTIVAGLATIVTVVIVARMVHASFLDLVRAYMPGVVGSAVMAACLIPFLRWASHHGALLQLGGGVILGATVYAVTVAIVDRDLLNRARHHFLTPAATA